MSHASEESSATRKRSPIGSLWFWVVLAFVFLLACWSTLIYLALQNKPQEIELDGDQDIPRAIPESAALSSD